MRTDKLTSKFQQALADAQSLAVGRDHQFIEPVHVLSALLEQRGPGVGALLTKAGANLNLLRSKLGQALDQLPVEIKTTVVLVILQGLSHMEAAIVQDCRPGTIAWRIHEARHRLRDILAEVEDTPVRLLTSDPTDELSRLLEAWGWPMLAPF